MSYKPGVGTVPARALAALRRLPAGHSIPTSELSVQIETDAAGLSSILVKSLVRAGLATRTGSGRTWRWRAVGPDDVASLNRDRSIERPIQRAVSAADATPLHVPRDPLSLAWKGR